MWWAELLNNVVALLDSAIVSTNSYESIATVTAGIGGTASFDFQNIPQTYKHLQLRFIAQSTYAASVDNLAMYLNNDTSNVYSTHTLYGLGSSASANNFSSSSRFYLPSLLSAATTGQFTIGAIDILDYTSTNKYKTIRTLHGYDANGTGAVGLTSGSYQSTNAVTRFTGTTSLLFAQYSSFALYGVK